MTAFPVKYWKWLGVLTTAAVVTWAFLRDPEPTTPPASPPVEERIPPGIVVTESSSPGAAAPTTNDALGDRILTGYANPSLPPRNDLVLMARAISSFLVIAKTATERPLSANEEWSAALRGKRPGTDAWISEEHRALNHLGQLVDRWGTPLHFHALGGKKWQIRSAGPDHKLFTEDDLMESISG
jgi:hypothetical protein